MQIELQVAFVQLLLRGKISLDGICAVVPQDDFSRAVIPFGNVALKAAVIEWMVFGLNRQAFVGRIKRRTFWNSPGFQHAVQFQTEIVMKPSGVMALHYERILSTRSAAASRLGTLARWTLALIFGQRIHAASIFLFRQLLPLTSATKTPFVQK